MFPKPPLNRNKQNKAKLKILSLKIPLLFGRGDWGEGEF